MPELSISQALQLGLQHHQAGRLDQAESIYRQILARQQHPDALHLLGLLAGQIGRLPDAIDMVQKAIAASPRTALYRINLGKFLTDSGRFDEAVTSCREALRLDPKSAEAYSNLAVAQKNLGRLAEAADSCRSAIRLKPNYGEAQINLGNTLKSMGRLEEAIATYDEVLHANPNYAEAHFNRGIALYTRGRLDEAIASYRRALAIKPNFADAHNFLGNTLSAQGGGQLDEALTSFRTAIALNPKSPVFHSNLLLALNYHPATTPQMLHQESLRWAQQHAAPLAPTTTHPNDRAPDRPLRIGYISADFRAHPVGRFLLPLLQHHDRAQFEIHCYSDTLTPDATTQALQQNTSAWHSIVGLSDHAVADLIRSHGIDILIDLAGHTAGHRLLVFARKPAPLQISYLGYPATTGLAAIDYRLTDPLADPPNDSDSFYTEKLWRLPVTNWCYLPPTAAPAIQPPPTTTSTPPRPLTFGSFNNFTKVTPQTLDLWSHILTCLPASRLLLKSLGLDSPAVRQHLHSHFSSRGINPARIELQGWLRDPASHMAAYHQIDIALDTFPYHGTTTTCEALWMGVPVITLAGHTHVSRVGLSLLTNAGLPHFIAHSPQQCVSLATTLAADPATLTQLRHSLRQTLQTSPLMDAARFARDVESAYRQMWQAWCAKTP